LSPPQSLSLPRRHIARRQAPSTLLIRGATIIDGLADAPVRGRSLLIEENIIRGLPPADAPAPAGAQVLDLAGNSSFRDCSTPMCHWDAFMGELLVNHGVTSILALDNVPKALRARSQDAHDVPRLFHTGPRPQLTPELHRGRYQRGDTDLAAIRTRSGVVPQYNARFSRAYKFAADEAHKAGLMVFGHTDDAPGAIRDGIDILEHVWATPRPLCRPRSCDRFRKATC